MMKKNNSKEHKWRVLMQFVSWQGHANWEIINTNTFEISVVEFKQWVIDNLTYIDDKDVKRVFRDFYFGTGSNRSQHDYTRKKYGDYAMQAMYRKEIAGGYN